MAGDKLYPRRKGRHEMKIKREKRAMWVICGVVALLLTVIPFSISAVLYETTFGRYETEEPYLGV